MKNVFRRFAAFTLGAASVVVGPTAGYAAPLTGVGSAAPGIVELTPTILEWGETSPNPFVCSDLAWTVQGSNGTITTWDLTQSPFVFNTIATLGFTGNALAYNPLDGLLYATRPNEQIYSIDAAGVVTNLGVPVHETTGAPLPSAREFNVGTFGPDGTYYIIHTTNRNLFRVNVATGTYSVVEMPSTLNSFDMAWDPNTGLLTTIENDSRVLRTVDPVTGAVTRTTLSGATTAKNGAVIIDASGALYPYSNNGVLYRVDPPLSTGTIEQIDTGPSSNQNDGASCTFGAKVFKSVTPTTATIGDTVTYSFEIFWQGPEVTTASFSDSLSFGGVYDPATLAVDGVPTSNPLGGTATIDGSNLDLSGMTLTTGANHTITIDVELVPGTTTGDVDNQATLAGLGSNFAPAPSDFPGTGQLGDPTPLSILALPNTSAVKSVGTAVPNGDGTFNVPFSITVQNTGATVLENLTLADDLPTQLGSAFVAVVGDPAVTSSAAAPPSPNLAFSPGGTGELIDATGASLQPGESYTVDFTVQIDPAQATGPLTNQATAGGTDPVTGTTITDNTDSGTDPTTGNPGQPGDTVDPVTGESGTDDPTPVDLPALGVSKDVVSVSPAASGTVGNVDVTYTLSVENTGTTELTDVSLVDDVASQFGTAFVGVSGAPTITSNTASSTATEVGGYDGTGALATATSMAVGESFTASVTIEVDPNADPASLPLNNQATANGTFTDASGATTPVTDNSDAGTDPGTDNGSGGTDDPTPVEVAQIGVAKSAGSPVLTPDGMFEIPYEFVVSNTGTVNLTSLSLIDDLESQFGAGSIVGIAGAPTVSGTTGPNAGFTGTAADPELLDGTGTLAPGESFTVNVTVTVDASLATIPLENQATASAANADDPTDVVSDLSDAGSDPEGTNGAGGSNDPTAVVTPAVGVAKAVTNVSPSATTFGDQDVTFQIKISNVGLESVEQISLVDDVATQFGSAFVGVVSPPTIVSSDATGTVNGNANYLVGGDLELLDAAGAVLPPAGSIVVEVVVQVDPDAAGAPTPLTNQASVAVVGATTGNPATDVSDSGTNTSGTNPGAPGNTGGPDDPTPLSAPALSSTKTVSEVNASATTGHVDVTYVLSVQNTGNVPVDQVSLVDNLNATFGAALVGVVSTSIDTSAVTGSPAPGLNSVTYDGALNTELLDLAGTLESGDRVDVTIVVEIDPTADTTSDFTNQATAAGLDPDGNPLTDLTDSGTDPTTTNEGEPGATTNGPDDPTPLQLPQISVAKSVTVIGPASTPGHSIVEFTFVVKNTGSEVLTPIGLTDDFTAQLGSAFVGVTTPPAITTSTATADPTLGSGNPDIFVGSDGELAPGQSLTVTMQTEIDPAADIANLPLENQATASGDFVDAAGASQTTTDTSDSGTDPTTGNTGEPGDTLDPITGESGKDDPTPIALPQIVVAKAVEGTPVAAASGTPGNYDVTYSFVTTNTGSEVLNGLELTDDWSTELGGAFVGVVTAPQITASTATTDPTLDQGNPKLFVGTDGELAPGESITVTMTVEVDPDASGAVLPIANQATASGTDQYGTATTDASDSGTDPTSGNPGEPGNTVDPDSGANGVDDPTPLRLPEISSAKSVGSPTPTANAGEFTVDYTIVVRNTGSETLTNLSVSDNLALQLGDAFASASATSVTNIDADTAPGLNSGFDGTTDVELLDGTGTVRPGQSFSVELTVVLTPFAGAASFPLTNQATSTGTWIDPDTGNTATVSDFSDSGGDPTGNNGEGTTSDPTQIINPAIRVAKSVANTVDNGDGTATVTYNYSVQNYGFEDLYGVVLSDNIVEQLGGSAVVNTVGAPSVTVQPGTTFGPNPAFDGTAANPGLIIDASSVAADDGLAPGESITVAVDVIVVPAAATPPLFNQASATGANATDVSVSDLSDSGTNPATSNSDAPNDSGGTDDPTPLQLPSIAASKAVSSIAATPTPGVFEVTYSMAVKNTGSETLSNLGLEEDLSAVFGSALVATSTATIVGGDATALPAPDADFDGVASTDLLDGTGTLEPGQSFVLELTVTIDADADATVVPFENSVTASADWTDADGVAQTITDVSDSGVDPASPNDDADGATPGGTADPTPLALPSLAVAKSVGSIEAHPGGPVGTYDVTYEFAVANTGSQTVTNLTLVDDLAAQLGGGFLATIDGPNVSNGNVDPVSDLPSAGAGVPDLLGGDGSIDPGENFLVSVTVQVDATALGSSVTNSAVVSGVDPADPNATPITDTSDSGTDPTTGNPDAPGNSVDPDSGVSGADDPTPLVIADISVAKASTFVGPASSGTSGHFDVRFDYVVANTGNQDLTGLSLTDDLATQFGDAFIAVVGPVTVDAISAPNAGFDGAEATELLDGSGSLTPGGSFTVSIVAELDPALAVGDLVNQATAAGSWTDANGNSSTVEDLSDAGTDPTTGNPDANGNTTNPDTGAPNTSDPTPLVIPALGVAKSVAEVVNPASSGIVGNVDVRYQFTVANTGNQVLSSVALIDDLATQLGATFVGVVTAPVVTEEDLAQDPVADAAYDGTATLASAPEMQPGESFTVEVVIEADLDATANLEGWLNQATATATDPGGNPVEDLSDTGTDATGTNPGQNNDTGGSDDATPLIVPGISLAKSATVVGPASSGTDGNVDVTFAYQLRNTGNTPLLSPTLTDDFATQFGAAFVGVVAPGVSVDDVGIPNPSFDGDTDTSLLGDIFLAGLSPGESFNVTVTVEVDPSAATFDLENQAEVVATWNDPNNNSGSVSDLSDSGADANSTNEDGDGASPGGADDPTPLILPDLSVAKSAASVGPAASGAIGNVDVTYQFVVANAGTVTISGVDLVDDLVAQLGSAFIGVTTAPVVTDTTASTSPAAVDGYAGTGALATGAVIEPSQGYTVEVVVEVDPDQATGPLFNQATVNGALADGSPISDLSDSGTDPRTGNTGEPGDTVDPDSGASGTDDPTPLVVPSISLSKSSTLIGPAASGATGHYDVEFTVSVANTGNVDLSGLSVTDDLATEMGAAFVGVISAPTVSAVSGANPAFDGSGTTELLDGTGLLNPGATFDIVFVVEVDPSAVTPPIENQATGEADWTDPDGNVGTVTDLSDAGSDPTGSNETAAGASEGGTDDPTPVSIGAIAVAKSVTSIADPASSGAFGNIDVTYEFVVRNVGSVDVTEVGLADDLSSQLGSAFVGVVSAPELAATTASVDPTIESDYDGTANLATAGELAGGEAFTISVVVEVDPDATGAVLENQAVVSGIDETGAPVTDLSDSGTDPTSPNTGEPGDTVDPDTGLSGADDPTPLIAPKVGVAKSATVIGPASSGAVGNADVELTFVVGNAGSLPLTNLSLTDDLAAQFGEAFVGVVSAPVVSAISATNTAFDGTSITEMLDGSGVLAPGDSFEVTVVIEIDPTVATELNNQATAGGAADDGKGGTISVTDLSDSGTDPAGTNEGEPGSTADNPDDPTPLLVPGIAISKQVTDTAVAADGTAEVTFELQIANVGMVDLVDLSVTDDLASQFGPGFIEVVSAESPELIISTGFDGSSDAELLASGNTLTVGSSASISLVVLVDPDADGVAVPMLNQAIVSGTDTDRPDLMVSDKSDSGADPTDVNDDAPGSTPAGRDDPTPVVVASMDVDKTFIASEDLGDGRLNVTYRITATNTGNVALTELVVTDDVDTTFASLQLVDGSEIVIDGSANANADWDGSATSNVFSPGQSLPVGSSADVTIRLTIAPTADTDVTNVASGTATGPNGPLDPVEADAPTTIETTYGMISGAVFVDVDANGANDGDDRGLEGVTISLVDTDGNVVATTTTGPDGTYSFDTVPPGDYTVVETQPDGYGSSTPSSLAVSLGSAEDATADFGDTGAVISGHLWIDANGDGTNDDGEDPAPAGTVVKLVDEDGNVVATTTTDADGNYEFVGVPAGTYTVEVAPPSGYGFTDQSVAPGGSDVNPVTGRSGPVTVGYEGCDDPSQTDCQLINAEVDAGLDTEEVVVGAQITSPKQVGVGEIAEIVVTPTNDSNVTLPDGVTYKVTVPPCALLDSVTAAGYDVSIDDNVVTLVWAEALAPGESPPPYTVRIKSTKDDAGCQPMVEVSVNGRDDAPSPIDAPYISYNTSGGTNTGGNTGGTNTGGSNTGGTNTGGSGSGSGGTGFIPGTGGQLGAPVGTAVALTLAGIALVALARRRRRFTA